MRTPKKITEKELINNAFVTINGSILKYSHPNKKELAYRDLCICNGIEAIRFRGINGAISSANTWLQIGDNGELRALDK